MCNLASTSKLHLDETVHLNLKYIGETDPQMFNMPGFLKWQLAYVDKL